MHNLNKQTPKKSIWGHKNNISITIYICISMYMQYQYYNFKKCLIVVYFLFFVKCLFIFCSIFKQSAWTASPLVESKENFGRTSNARRRSDFPRYSIGSFSKTLLTFITLSSPLLILLVLKNSANTSESVSGGCTVETSMPISVNETAYYLLVQDLVEDFVKHQSPVNPWMDHLRQQQLLLDLQ